MYKYLINILFPELCVSCDSHLITQEKFLCSECVLDLPCTNLHKINGTQIKDIFYGSVLLEQATALFYYHKKGKIQQLIHHLKYKDQIEISSYLGKWLGADLKECDSYNDIDYVIPVPLHSKRLKSRGYNQVEGFGKEIAKELRASYCNDLLLRVENSKTQTKKTRWLRSTNTETVFTINEKRSEQLEGKHLLLVDDVITTGATVKACAKQLFKTKGIKLSLAVMAYAE